MVRPRIRDATAARDARTALEQTSSIEPLPGTRRFAPYLGALSPYAVLQIIEPADMQRAIDAFVESETLRIRGLDANLTDEALERFAALARAYWPKICLLQQRHNRMANRLRSEPDAPDEQREEWEATRSRIQQSLTDLLKTESVRLRDEVFDPVARRDE